VGLIALLRSAVHALALIGAGDLLGLVAMVVIIRLIGLGAALAPASTIPG
jgi:hypothetical protein